jgi:hypothetical protein
VVAGLANGTALVWNVAPAVGGSLPPSPDLSEQELGRVWIALGNEDAAAGQAAVQALISHPPQALAFLKGRLQPAAEANPQRIQQLLIDLGADRFAVREAATRELERQGERAEAVLRQALTGKLAPEVRRRLEAILNGFPGQPTPETLRQLRAIQALEHMASSDARDLLKVLARGAPGAWETQEATAALERATQVR